MKETCRHSYLDVRMLKIETISCLKGRVGHSDQCLVRFHADGDEYYDGLSRAHVVTQ